MKHASICWNSSSGVKSVTSASVSLHGLSAYANGETIQDLFSEIDKASEQIHAMEHLFFSIF